MFLYSMWMLVHLIHLVLSSATLSNEIFCGSFLCFLRACHKSEMSFIHQSQEQESGRRPTHYVNASAPDPSGVVLCNPFK